MTEVPEHLLQRSRDARKRLGFAVDDDGAAPEVAAAASANAPAVVEGAAAPQATTLAPLPEVAAPPPPPPEAPWVTAAKERKKIPAWVMPVLLFLPIWAFMYVGTLEEPTRVEPVLALGGEVYESQCASCHGGEGGGGVGPAFSGGALISTFPEFAEQIEWVAKGTEGFQAEGRQFYGANDTLVGDVGIMPAFGTELTAEELTAVIFYERIELSGHEVELDLAIALFEAFEGGEIAVEEFGSAVTVQEILGAMAETIETVGPLETAAE